MIGWRFFDYCSEAGNNLIEEWYLSQREDVQADFDTTLKTLSIFDDWRELKEFKMLGRQGLGEIRFKTANVQYRPIGSFGPGERSFTLWVGCKKKQNIYDPLDIFDLVLRRQSLYERGKVCLRERVI